MTDKKPSSGASRKMMAAIAVSAAVFVPLTVVGAPALARSASAASEYEYSGSSQYQYKVQLCHRTHSKKHQWVTITVSSHAVNAHIRHGDQMPPCPTVSSSGQHDSGSTTGSQTDSGKHGNGNGNGNSDGSRGNGHGNDHGNGNDNGGNGKGNGHHP